MPSSLGRSGGLDVTPTHEPIACEELPPPRSSGTDRSAVCAWRPCGDTALSPELGARSGGLLGCELSAGLTSPVALKEIDSLLTSSLPAGLGVTDDDARSAVGILCSLPPKQQREVLEGLARNGQLRVWVAQLPADARAALLECAVSSGLVKERPEAHATERTPQPPPRPALLDNQASLPTPLRELIHAENQHRAQGYADRFEAYVSSYCEAVQQAADPAGLRALGPLSSPPSLHEPGITDVDRKYRQWKNDLVGSCPGIERAARAVSDRVSDFRGEIHAGGFSLGLELTAKATLGKTLAIGQTASVELSDDGRLLNPKQTGKTELSTPSTDVKASATFDAEGHLKTVKGTVLNHGLELDKQGKVTFSVKEGPATLSTFVDGKAAKYGAAIGAEASGEYLDGRVKFTVGAKATLTAQGIPREYYQDIGGAQGGLFGPMPELDQGSAWTSLPKGRQEWYARQGFTEKLWPGRDPK